MLELVRAQNSKLKPEKFRPVPAYFEVVNWISCLKTRLTRCEGCRSEELQKGREQEFPILEFRSASPASTDQEWHGCSCRRNRPLATLAWEINKSIEIDSFCLYTTSIQDFFFLVFFSTVSSRYVNYKKFPDIWIRTKDSGFGSHHSANWSTTSVARWLDYFTTFTHSHENLPNSIKTLPK